MNNDAIAKFCEAKDGFSTNCLRIDLKKREPVYGFIIAAADYDDLKSKNFWRIVLHSNFQKWKDTGNLDFAKIYNGTEFTKLSVAENKKVI
jgi:hypothetical protein